MTSQYPGKNTKTTSRRVSQGNLQAGRFDMSAETAQGIPRLVRAPRIIPQGKYSSMLVICAPLSAPNSPSDAASVFPTTAGSSEIRVSHLKWLSCSTNVPYELINQKEDFQVGPWKISMLQLLQSHQEECQKSNPFSLYSDNHERKLVTKRAYAVVF